MNQERLLQILVAPHVSEKATILADSQNQHVFQVAQDATKLEVKHAVEQLFTVKVDSVRLLRMKGKSKRFQQVAGRRNHTKKAYVKLAEGQDIDFQSLGS